MKKFLLIVLSVIVLLIAVLLLVPLFYSLDNLRPRIEQMVNQKVRGDVKLGHLSFSLLPQLKIGAEHVELREHKGVDEAPFGKIESFQIRMSLMSLLTSPKATIRLNGLDINLTSSEQKGDNLKNFLPEALPPEATPVPTDPNPLAGIQKQLSDVLVDVPGFVRSRILSARFSVELIDSHVSDKAVTKTSRLDADVKNLSFRVTDIGFNSPIQIESQALLAVEMKGLKIQGPYALKGQVTLTPASGESSSLKFSLNQKLDDVAIAAFGLLDKQAGTPLNAELGGEVKFGKLIDANVDTLSFQFGGIKTTGSLSFRAEKIEDAVVDLKIQSEKIDMAGLGTLVPMVRNFKLKGQTDLRAHINGSTKNPDLDVQVRLANLSGATPQLAKPITGVNGSLNVSGNLENPHVVLKDFALKIGRSDLAMTMTSDGLENIKAKMNVSSNLLDGDELMGVAPPAGKGGAAGGKPGSPTVDPNASLDDVLDKMAPMVDENLKNPVLDRITLTAGLNVKKINFAGAEYSNAVVDAKLANRKLTMTTGNMGAYGGHVQANMDLGLKPGLLEYTMKAKLDKIQVADAIKAHAPAWKNAMSGSLVGAMSIEGKGLRKEQLSKSLKGTIAGSMEAGRLSLPVMQLVTMFISKLPKQAGEKLNDQEFRGDFKTMKFQADIVGRSMKIRELNVIYDPKKAQIGDLRFSATGDLNFDKQINFDATAFVSPEVIRVNELKGASGQVEIPMKLGGTMEAPKPDVMFTTKILSERFVKGAAKKELQKLAPKVIDEIKKNVPAPVQNQLDELKKKFHF